LTFIINCNPLIGLINSHNGYTYITYSVRSTYVSLIRSSMLYRLQIIVCIVVQEYPLSQTWRHVVVLIAFPGRFVTCSLGDFLRLAISMVGSMGDSIGDSIGDSMGDSMGDSQAIHRQFHGRFSAYL